MKRLILVPALLMAMSGALADKPYDLNGLTLGTPLANVQDQRRWDCIESKSHKGQATCFLDSKHKESIGGVAMDTVTLQFHERRLSAISAFFPEQDFDKVLDALKAKYGNPRQESTTSAVCLDTKSSDREAIWSNGVSSVKAKKCNRQMFRSMVEISRAKAKF
ncbi:MAG TPA: hypothetical protein VEG36_03850 [Burkholderiales bacterium]|nr:hypothetical protein [Burkholderiales bacterium]